MPVRAIIILHLFYCSSLFSQSVPGSEKLFFSRQFDALKKNVPLTILNNHPDHFYLLRYNKLAHDLVIERRAKPSGEMVAYTPLKLDSVNANWFNYEELGHLFYEWNNHVYFLFEKELNFRKEIYLKITDSAGRSSGFIELAMLEKDAATFSIDFSYQPLSRGRLLIVSTRSTVNGIRRRIAMLYDPEKRELTWTKKLPLENIYSNLTANFGCNDAGDLFYLAMKSGDRAVDETAERPDSLFLVTWRSASEAPERTHMNTNLLHEIKNSIMVTGSGEPLVIVQGFNSDAKRTREFFLVYQPDSSGIKRVSTPMEGKLEKQLTFYDGPFKESWLKYHNLLKIIPGDSSVDLLLERVEQYYSKELIFLSVNKHTGAVTTQKLIPRKLLFFRERNRFKNLGTVMLSSFRQRPSFIMLESPANFSKTARDFSYHQFTRETSLWRTNVVMYTLEADGELSKELIYRNAEFDLIPLRYESTYEGDIVFYLNSGRYEKFGFIH